MTTSSGAFTVNPTRDHAAVDTALRRTAGAFIDPRNRAIDQGQDSRTGQQIDATVGLQEGLDIFWGNSVLLQQVVQRDCSGGGLSQQQVTSSRCAEVVEQQSRVVGALARAQVDQQVQSYLNVMNAMRPWPGRKALVLVSDGVAAASREQRIRFDAIAKAAAAAGIEVSVLTQEPDQVGADDRSAVQASVRREDGQALMAGAETIADLTGGHFYRVIGTPDRFFDRVSMASSAVYHLGVEAPASSDPGRDFALSARVTRDNLTVHANRHAIAPAPMVMASTDEQLKAGVANGALAYGVPLTLATVLRRGASTSQVDVGANVEVPGSVTGPITVMFGLVDLASGTLRTGKTTIAAPVAGGNYRVSLSLPVATGAYRLRFAVADAAGHVGSLGIGVKAELTRLGPLQLSDVLTSWTGTDGKPQFLALEEIPSERGGASVIPGALPVEWRPDTVQCPGRVESHRRRRLPARCANDRGADERERPADSGRAVRPCLTQARHLRSAGDDPRQRDRRWRRLDDGPEGSEPARRRLVGVPRRLPRKVHATLV